MGAWRKLLLIVLILGVCGLVRSEGDSGANAKENPRNETTPGPLASPPHVAPSDAKREDTALTDSGASNVTASTGGGSDDSSTKDEKQPDVKKDEQDAGKKDEQAIKNEHCCETPSKVRACLSSPGDASNGILSLIVRSRTSSQVEITIPEFLSADRTTFTTESEKDFPVRIEMVDPEAAKQRNSTIKIKSDGECELEVPFKNLGYEDKTDLSYSSLWTPAPVVGFIMFAAALVIVVSSWAYCRYRAKKKSRHGETAEDRKYVELEMGLYDPNNPTASTGTHADDNNWDEGWDEDWEDSQFKLTKSLSAKGLASRRISKDGWSD